jgi:CheY-like chemotaxis protein
MWFVLMVEQLASADMDISATLIYEQRVIFVRVCYGNMVLDIIDTIQPDLFLFDYSLPAITGIELYDLLHCKKGLKDVPAIIMLEEDEINKLIASQIKRREITSFMKHYSDKALLEIIAAKFGFT